MRLSFLALLLPCLSLSLIAQYPEYRPIDPYPLLVKARHDRHVFRFENSDGWQALHHVKLEARDNKLRIQATGFDPYFTGPPLLPLLKAGKQPPVTGTFELTIRLSIDHDTAGQLFWITSRHPGWSEKQSVRFALTGDGKFRDYTLRCDADGELLQFRIDPGNEEGHAEIESITLRQIEFQSPRDKIKPKSLTAESVVLEGATKIIQNESGSLRLEYQTDGAAAILYRDNIKAAVVAPLCPFDDYLPIAGKAWAENFAAMMERDLPMTTRGPGRGRLPLVLTDDSPAQCVFQSTTTQKWQPVKNLRLWFDGDLLRYCLVEKMVLL